MWMENHRRLTDPALAFRAEAEKTPARRVRGEGTVDLVAKASQNPKA